MLHLAGIMPDLLLLHLMVLLLPVVQQFSVSRMKKKEAL